MSEIELVEKEENTAAPVSENKKPEKVKKKKMTLKNKKIGGQNNPATLSYKGGFRNSTSFFVFVNFVSQCGEVTVFLL